MTAEEAKTMIARLGCGPIGKPGKTARKRATRQTKACIGWPKPGKDTCHRIMGLYAKSCPQCGAPQKE